MTKQEVNGDQEIADMKFAQAISYQSGMPIAGILAITRRLSAAENRIKVLEAQKGFTNPAAEYRGK